MTPTTIPLQGLAFANFISAVFLTLFNTIPWVLVFLLTQCVGVRLYVLKDKEVCLRIQKRLTRCSHVADGNKGYGFSIGYWYFASVSVSNNDGGAEYDVWMIATASSYERLTSELVGSVPVVDLSLGTGLAPQSLVIFHRVGSFFNAWYKRRTVRLSSIIPRADQTVIMDAICQHLAEHQHTVIYLHGPAGSGKSMIGILLANRLGGAYCNTLKPWQPGDILGDLVAEVEPSAAKPLIIAFDEVDGAIQAIHAGIPPHKSLPIAMANKAGWNHMLDEIGRGMYPHIVLLLTSNRDPAFIRDLDPSYIRLGRVDMVLSLDLALDLALTKKSD